MSVTEGVETMQDNENEIKEEKKISVDKDILDRAKKYILSNKEKTIRWHMKNLLDLQRKIKGNVNGYKSGNYIDLEEERKKDEKRKLMEKQRKRKLKEREKGDNEESEEGDEENEEEDDKKSGGVEGENSNDKSGSEVES